MKEASLEKEMTGVITVTIFIITLIILLSSLNSSFEFLFLDVCACWPCALHELPLNSIFTAIMYDESSQVSSSGHLGLMNQEPSA